MPDPRPSAQPSRARAWLPGDDRLDHGASGRKRQLRPATENSAGHGLNSLSNRERLTLILLILLVLLIGVLHAVTPGDQLVLHDIYRRASYLPIVVAAILFGIRGGLALALVAIVSFIPHLRHFYLMGWNAYLAELPEIVLYLAAGLVTGAIAGREKRVREQCQQQSRQLTRSYRRLHEQTALLLEVEDQLRASQKLSALGQLAASLAHEIKNPLGSIRGAVEILRDDYPADHPKREFISILIKESNRLAATVDEVLRFSRSRPEEERARPRTMLTEIIDQVSTLLDNRLRKKDIRLERAIGSDSGQTLLDADRMSQVCINLLLNAVEAVPAGGRIRITADNTAAGNLRLVVEDNGPGIGPADREKVFRPFYSTRSDGTGLGLAISSRIIESCGGRISVDDSPLGGARFTVLLPEHGCDGRNHEEEEH